MALNPLSLQEIAMFILADPVNKELMEIETKLVYSLYYQKQLWTATLGLVKHNFPSPTKPLANGPNKKKVYSRVS